MSETARLEADVANMGDRLDSLRAQMCRERERREQPLGGWQSAKVDTGSLLAYGREARSRAITTRSKPNRGRQPSSFASVDIMSWGTNDVCDWLEAIELGQYREMFQAKMITGEQALALGLDDLDYLEIRAVAHRKKLLKAVADLNAAHARRLTLRAFAQNEPPPEPASDSQVRKPPTPPVKRTHWSALLPLADNGKPDSPPSSLLTTGSTVWHNPKVARGSLLDGEVDETAERLAFQRAVEDWRRGVVSVEASTGSSINAGIAPPKSASQVATELAERLDRIYTAETQVLAQRKKEAQERLEHAMSLCANLPHHAPPSPPARETVLEGTTEKQTAFYQSTARISLIESHLGPAPDAGVPEYTVVEN